MINQTSCIFDFQMHMKHSERLKLYVKSQRENYAKSFMFGYEILDLL